MPGQDLTISRRKEEHKWALLEALRCTHTIIGACGKVGCSRDVYYNYCSEDESFRLAAKKALQESREKEIEDLRSMAFKRAMAGSDRMIIELLEHLDSEFKASNTSQIQGELTLKILRESADDS